VFSRSPLISPKMDCACLSYGFSASPAGEDGQPGIEELCVIGDLRHGPHSGARGPHGIALLDGQGRRDSLDPLDKGTVHAVEELAGIGEKVST